MIANTSTWFAAVIPLFFVGMWLFVSNLLSRMGGWAELAASYSTAELVDGQTYRFRSGRVGPVSYNSCLNLTAGAAGLRVAVLFPFRLGHRPFVVPWVEITATEHRGWVFNYVDLQFSQKPQVRLRVSRSLAEALVTAGGSALRIK